MQQGIVEIREHFVNRLCYLLGIGAAVGLIVSSAIYANYGLLPLHFLHIIIYSTCFLVFFFRNALSFHWKVGLTLAVFSVTTAGSLFQYGVLSVGFLLAVVVVLIANIIYGRRSGIVAATFMVLVMIITFLIETLGFANPASLSNSSVENLSSPVSWLKFILTFIVVSYLLCHILGKMIFEMQELIYLTDNQKRKIEQLANYDKLTGLPSVRLADDRIDMAIAIANRNETISALLYLDLDGFKSINDSFGHDAGDEVLREVSKRFSDAIRDTDTCCRIGGDEFLIIVPDIKDKDVLETICKRILNTSSSPISYGNEKLIVGVSIGVSIYPDNAITGRELRSKADEAMYKVKKSGKNDIFFAENNFRAASE